MTDMMFTCTTPVCTDPRHGHRFAGVRKGSAAAVRARKRSVSSKLVRDRKGRSLRVDIHCHYLNRDAAAKLAHLNPAQHEPSVKFASALTREVNVKQMQDRAAKLSTIEVRLEDMDRMGIDIQAVSPAPQQTYYWTEPGLGAELSRCVKQLDLRGVEINPNVAGKELTDPGLSLDRFFAKARELDIVIFMHPIGFTQGDRLMDHYLNNVIGNPLDTTVGASHLIFGGMMEKHPGLKVVLPHAGGFLGHYWARMDHAWRARPDCRTVIKKPPTSYLKKFFFDTITFDPEMLRNLIDKFGAAQVLLGTDYPFDMGEEDPVGLINSVPRLPSAEKERIMGGNAARLLKIRR